jgi:uncharacterized protein (DUF2249 family)
MAAAPTAALRRVDVDVRADITAGHEPFARIMSAVQSLEPDQALVLHAPFEPIPLYAVLGKRGFSHWTEAGRPGDWSVWFFRGAEGPGQGTSEPATTPTARACATLDVRDLEPPLPLLRVLERLDTLGTDGELIVLHDRRPVFLYPQIEARGFVHSTEEPEPGLVHIVIRRRPGSA